MNISCTEKLFLPLVRSFSNVDEQKRTEFKPSTGRSEFDAVNDINVPSSNGGIGTQTHSDNGYRAPSSHDVTAVILVFQNNETDRQILRKLDSFLM